MAGSAVAVICAWCQAPIPPEARRDALTCSKSCRQTLFRARRLAELDRRYAQPCRFAYADPPYPGTSARYYRNEPSFAGEVDHAALIERLTSGGYLGWALSTSEAALRAVLPLCPSGARVCPWVKPHGVSARSRGLHNAWEPLIVVGGRQQPPGRRDWLRAMPARRGGTLPGRKPLAFCVFLFEALGMVPGDSLDDLFPGTGVVARAWAAVQAGKASLLEDGDASEASLLQAGDAFLPCCGATCSSGAHSDVSPEALTDTSRAAADDGSPALELG